MRMMKGAKVGSRTLNATKYLIRKAAQTEVDALQAAIVQAAGSKPPEPMMCRLKRRPLSARHTWQWLLHMLAPPECRWIDANKTSWVPLATCQLTKVRHLGHIATPVDAVRLQQHIAQLEVLYGN